MNDFRAGRQIAPNVIVTTQQDADYLLRELANVKARNKYLQEYSDMQRECAEDAIRTRDDARDSLQPWMLAAALGWVLAIVEFIAR